MGIDKKTVATFSICVDDKLALLKLGKQNNINISGEVEHDKNPKIWFSEDLGSMNTEEYYYDESNNTIFYSGDLQTPSGQVFISISIPLSDVVLIDVLQAAIKKLNKLKTAMETLR